MTQPVCGSCGQPFVDGRPHCHPALGSTTHWCNVQVNTADSGERVAQSGLPDQLVCDPKDEGRAWCGVCGYPLQLVRPGKWQCPYCELRELLERTSTERDQVTERAEASQRMLTEALGELHQVCEILGGPQFTESAIDLAREAAQMHEQLDERLTGLLTERDAATERAREAGADLRLNARMLARQCDLAREAETGTMRAEAAAATVRSALQRVADYHNLPWPEYDAKWRASGDDTAEWGDVIANVNQALTTTAGRDLLARLAAAEGEGERLLHVAIKSDHEIQQILGRALGCPWYRDDPKNFPDATEADGVCTGDATGASLALEAGSRLARLERAVERVLSEGHHDPDCRAPDAPYLYPCTCTWGPLESALRDALGGKGDGV